jgi:hypothetical protein
MDRRRFLLTSLAGALAAPRAAETFSGSCQATMTSACRQPVHTLPRPVRKQAVSRAELWAGQRSLVDGELLAQGHVLEGEVAVADDEEGQEPEQVEYESDHEPGLWPDRADRSATWLANEVLSKDRADRWSDHTPRREDHEGHEERAYRERALAKQREQERHRGYLRVQGFDPGVDLIPVQAALDLADGPWS